MDEEQRKHVVSQLDELRREVATKATDGSGPVLTQVDALRALVADANGDKDSARSSARGLEQRLLAWEAEHPTLVALANRIVRALEDAGL